MFLEKAVRAATVFGLRHFVLNAGFCWSIGVHSSDATISCFNGLAWVNTELSFQANHGNMGAEIARIEIPFASLIRIQALVLENHVCNPFAREGLNRPNVAVGQQWVPKIEAW